MFVLFCAFILHTNGTYICLNLSRILAVLFTRPSVGRAKNEARKHYLQADIDKGLLRPFLRSCEEKKCYNEHK